MIKTRITELFGIKHPIILAPMGRVSEVPLVAAVCNAGGLGLLAAGPKLPEELREEIRELKELVGNRPFGVNVLPHLPRYKRLIEVILEEKVPVFSHALGNPFKAMDIDKPDGMIFLPSIGAIKHGVRLEREGADAFLVTGWEAAGHCSHVASSVLIPLIANKVKVPFAAGGGFSDGAGLAAALALGADGIYMGTRFALTQESPLLPEVKEFLLQATENMPKESTSFTGFHLRAIKGRKVEKYRGWKFAPWEILPAIIYAAKHERVDFWEMISIYRRMRKETGTPLQFACGIKKLERAMLKGEIDKGFLPCGQVIGSINDIPSCQDLIDRTISQAEQIIGTLNKKIICSSQDII